MTEVGRHQKVVGSKNLFLGRLVEKDPSKNETKKGKKFPSSPPNLSFLKERNVYERNNI